MPQQGGPLNLEDLDYEIPQTTVTKSLLITIIKNKCAHTRIVNQTNGKIDYMAHKLVEIGVPLYTGLFSNDDEDIE